MDELTMKHLIIIKKLYQNAVEQSYLSEPDNAFSLLSFHDAIEMFLFRAATYQPVKSKSNHSISDYFTAIPELSRKIEIEALNKRRVNTKHYASIPSQIDIETTRVDATRFFEENTPAIFGIGFDEISLVQLINYPSVKKHLIDAEQALKNEEYKKSITESALAFDVIIRNYNDEHFNLFKSENLRTQHALIRQDNLMDKSTRNHFIQLNSAVLQLVDYMKITRFGISPKEYARFKTITPIILKEIDQIIDSDSISETQEEEPGKTSASKAPSSDEENETIDFDDSPIFMYKYTPMYQNNVKYNEQNAAFCFNFVINVALQKQKLDFDLYDLIDVE